MASISSLEMHFSTLIAPHFQSKIQAFMPLGTCRNHCFLPFHTPGCTTWSMQVKENGQVYNTVILGSLNVNPGYKLVHNKTYPNIAKDYKHAISVLKSLPCDIFLGAHAMYFDLEKKYKLLNQSKKNPFIDPVGYQQHVTIKESEFYEALSKP